MTNLVLDAEESARALRAERRRQWWNARSRRMYRRISRYASYTRLASAARLRRLENIHAGRRCFILGNGPSLARTNLSRLRNEITFGTNRVYPLFEELGFATTYFAAVDPLLVKHYHRDLDAIRTVKFLPARHRDRFTFDAQTIFLEEARPLWFERQPARGVWDGGSVTYVALQLAYFMGCDPVYLVGVDHRYTISKTHREDRRELVTVGDGHDADHFAADYFEKGVAWSVPNLELKELGYRMAKFAFERDRRRVLDATIGGALDIFEKADYETLFG
jgi:hypothetical protein